MPRRPLLLDARKSIVRAYDVYQKPIVEIAQMHDVSPSTLRSFLARYRNTGEIEAGHRGGSRFKSLSDHHLKWLLDQLDEYCNKTIDLLRQGLIDTFPEELGSQPPSSTTVWRTVTHKLRYRLKVIHVEPIDYNLPSRKDDRAKWCEDILREGIDLHDCIYLDESGFNLHVSNTYGRAAIGHRPINVRPSNRGPNITLILAMNKDGIVAYDLIQGGFKATGFGQFLETKVFPKLTRPEVFIMDNCKIHKTHAIRALFNTYQHRCEFLPAYSPYLNATEWVFGYTKPKCARRDYMGPETLRQMITSVVQTIDGAKCCGWIKAVHENFIKAMCKEPLGQTYQLAHKPCISPPEGTQTDDHNEDEDDDDDTATVDEEAEHSNAVDGVQLYDIQPGF